MANPKNRTPAPWYWLGNHSLVGGAGKRPAVLTGRDLRQNNPATGLLVPFDPMSEDGRTLAAAPALRAFAEEVAEEPCECDLPEEGESGIILCRRCRAREALASTRGA